MTIFGFRLQVFPWLSTSKPVYSRRNFFETSTPFDVELKKLERKLKREQRVLSRKYEAEKTRITQKQLKKGESTRKNVCKQLLKVQKLHQSPSGYPTRSSKQNRELTGKNQTSVCHD